MEEHGEFLPSHGRAGLCDENVHKALADGRRCTLLTESSTWSGVIPVKQAKGTAFEQDRLKQGLQATWCAMTLWPGP
jgi:hypothetical protein